ncbi:putative nuclease HARBI1 [Ornithodoros turicata]|uniref:putative nuclease HARBI1 n=1 Tax=Ornithodoros turicata TaxID=34597 RepID=UPI00313933BF
MAAMDRLTWLHERWDVEDFTESVAFITRCALLTANRRPLLAAVQRRLLYEQQNPLERYTNEDFKQRYRLSKATVVSIVEELLPLLRPYPNERGSPLPPLLQVITTLRFYAAGTFQLANADISSVSQPTVCRLVKTVSRAIATKLVLCHVTFPAPEGMTQAMQNFYTIASVPGVTGCIDCTHVRIKSPRSPAAETFRDRNGNFSTNVQAITGPELQFFDVVASWPGSVHDSRIFDNSRAKFLFEERLLPGILLGDSGYPCLPYLLTPLLQPRSQAEKRYNTARIKTRNVVERVFGVWKRRFSCLDMKLQTKVKTSVTIITACAALHNIARKMNDSWELADAPQSTNETAA